MLPSGLSNLFHPSPVANATGREMPPSGLRHCPLRLGYRPLRLRHCPLRLGYRLLGLGRRPLGYRPLGRGGNAVTAWSIRSELTRSMRQVALSGAAVTALALVTAYVTWFQHALPKQGERLNVCSHYCNPLQSASLVSKFSNKKVQNALGNCREAYPGWGLLQGQALAILKIWLLCRFAFLQRPIFMTVPLHDGPC
jgi:hypothetical protein